MGDGPWNENNMLQLFSSTPGNPRQYTGPDTEFLHYKNVTEKDGYGSSTFPPTDAPTKLRMFFGGETPVPTPMPSDAYGGAWTAEPSSRSPTKFQTEIRDDDDDYEDDDEDTKRPTKKPTKKPTKRPSKEPTSEPTNEPVSYICLLKIILIFILAQDILKSEKTKHIQSLYFLLHNILDEGTDTGSKPEAIQEAYKVAHEGACEYLNICLEIYMMQLRVSYDSFELTIIDLGAHPGAHEGT